MFGTVDAYETGPAAGARAHAGRDGARTVVGPLLVVLLIARSAVFGDDLKDATLEALRINDDMHRSMLVQGARGR